MAKLQIIALDLGCGENKATVDTLLGYGLITEDQKPLVKIIGVDNQKLPTVDKDHDLTQFPYPFKKESVDIVHTSHFLEHLDGPQRIDFFNEMYRILKPGGKMMHCHPYYKSARAIQDPTHKFPPICEESYFYWSKEWREVNKLGHYLGTCDFHLDHIHYTFHDPVWMTKTEEHRNFAIKHHFNVVADMFVRMIKK